MLVVFKDVRVTSLRTGISSKTGNPYGFLQFFVPAENSIYDLPFFGDDVAALEGIEPNAPIATISFALEPAPRGGVRLRPAW